MPSQSKLGPQAVPRGRGGWLGLPVAHRSSVQGLLSSGRSASLSWLATLPADQAMQVLMKNGGLAHADRYGPGVVRSVEALLREVKATARRGYGLAFSEAEFGVAAVAAAIRAGEGGPALGTVSIAGPTARISERRAHELAPLVLQSAAELSDLWPLRSGTGARSAAVRRNAASSRAIRRPSFA